MVKRMILMLVGVAVFVGAVATVKFRQIQLGAAQAASFQPPPEAVTTIVAGRESWPAGHLCHRHRGGHPGGHGQRRPAGHRQPDRLRVGGARGKGRGPRRARRPPGAGAADGGGGPARARSAQPRPDERPADAGDHLAGRERPRGRRAQAGRSAGRERSAPPSTARRSGRPSRGSWASARSTSASTCRRATPWCRCRPSNPIYVNFTVTQQDVPKLRVGGELRVAIEGVEGPGTFGRITAVDSVVDAATRNVQVQATLPNPDGRLRPGMFVKTASPVSVPRPRSSPCPRRPSTTRPTATRSSWWPT